MITFKPAILKTKIKADGIYNVKILVSHARVRRYIPTPFSVGPGDMTKRSLDLTTEFKITNQKIKEDVDDIIKKYRSICNELGEKLDVMSLDQIIEYIKSFKENTHGFQLDFIEYGNKKVIEMQKKGRTGSASCYRAMLSSLLKFIDRPTLGINEITVNFMIRYTEWLVTRPDNVEHKKDIRSISFYATYIRALHNMAKFEFNDDDNDIIRIPLSPFIKFKVPKAPVTRKRAITIEQLKAIVALPYMMPTQPGICRFNLAKDVFILSFCLIGMNTADLFSCNDLKAKWITYNRAKTKERRDDNAEISIHIEKEIQGLVEKYSDKTCKRVFNFYQLYSSPETFNTAVNKGLKQIGELEAVNISDLEFYAARHTWATIAINDVKIDKYTVHMALNHVDKEMKITDVYIKKTYEIINNANKKVLNYLKLKIDDSLEPKLILKKHTTLD